jgi:hypothetical protein
VVFTRRPVVSQDDRWFHKTTGGFHGRVSSLHGPISTVAALAASVPGKPAHTVHCEAWLAAPIPPMSTVVLPITTCPICMGGSM